jgi:SRSO17 transposase
MARHLVEFCDRYTHHFVGQGRNSVGHARHYLSGLLGTQRRKNIETIENDVSGSDYQGMEQFISSSPWKHQSLLDDVACDANELLGDGREAGLYIDESSFLKKGASSVGVQRQWSGRAGKVENCQVGVFACLGRECDFALVDFRLFLPESWTGDPARCEKARIPEGQRSYKAKWRQALEMVAHARENGVGFGWVGVDSLYGHNNQFINALEDAGERFMADVRKDYRIWTECPELEVPTRPASQRGKHYKRARLKDPGQKQQHLRVDEYVEANFGARHRLVSYRQGSKGELCAGIWAVDVWVWEGRWSGPPRKRRLVVRQDEAGEFKYSLTNLPGAQSWKRLAYVQGQRFWIEHAFHEAKSQLGMAQYQVRVWNGWHHHMALVALATVFMAREKARNKGSHPLLSYRDITELLDYYLPRRNRDENEVHEQISKRHTARQRDLDRRRKHKTGIPPDCNLTK